ncbi:MAG: hypothetical protein HKL90_01065 [Elusimicrobia bacterium]|nr:hypothetical protein [Elusimicrobiota bacterium]
MKFTKAQKTAIRDKGFVRIPGLVSGPQIRRALREINKALGRSSSYGKDGMPREADCQGPWSELKYSPAISGLFLRSAVKAAVESLIGKGRLDADLQRDVLIRFPQEASGHERTSFHIDGFEYGGGLGARNARSHGHTIAAAVLLSDAPRGGMGNLTLIPGSHRVLEKYFQEHPEGVERLEMPSVGLGAPVSVTGMAGDVIFYHYQVAHSAFARKNLSHDIHYAAIFWAKRIGHEERWREALTNIWLEWPGMRDVP